MQISGSLASLHAAAVHSCLCCVRLFTSQDRYQGVGFDAQGACNQQKCNRVSWMSGQLDWLVAGCMQQAWSIHEERSTRFCTLCNVCRVSCHSICASSSLYSSIFDTGASYMMYGRVMHFVRPANPVQQQQQQHALLWHGNCDLACC